MKFILTLSLALCAPWLAAQPTLDNNQPTEAPPHVHLLKITLSKAAWKAFDQRSVNAKHHISHPNLSPFIQLPPQVQLGMNGVPVLDQGDYGTCATFAITAAIDALLNQGDKISQLCLLQLSQHLEHYSYKHSNWKGSNSDTVFHELEMYGFVSKDKEQTNGCGGLTTYPERQSHHEPDEAAPESDNNTPKPDNATPESELYEVDPGPSIPTTEMTLAEYKLLSEPLDGIISYSILDAYQSLWGNIDMTHILDSVKQALYEGDRLLLSSMLFLPRVGVNGALGQYHVPNDSWIITPEIDLVIRMHGPNVLHMMVITGYDDNATVIDRKGRTHIGLLTVRNSWGTEVGDAGDFYMSYDYFKRLTLEVRRIHQMDF